MTPANNNWIEHLIELRRRLIICLITIGIVLIPLVYFATTLYHVIALPLLNALPKGGQMIATTVTSPLFVPLQLAFGLAVFISIPIMLYHLWAFIAPGLYKHEKQLVWPLLFCSTLLFYLGTLFAYFVIFPLLFRFFTHAAPTGVLVMTDINAYLSFVLKLFFAFGVSFEIPILIFILTKTNIITYEKLKAARRYIIVAAFIIGMLLGPPDVISQTLLALPIWVLYEIGLLAVKLFQPKIQTL